MKRKILLKSIFITLYFLLLLVPNTFSQSKKVASFVQEYAQVACWEVEAGVQPMMRWEKDTIRYKIVGDFQFVNKKEWTRYLLSVEDLTGKTILQTEEEDYHILMFFGSLSSYAELTNNRILITNQTNFNSWSSRNWDRKTRNLVKSSFCIVPAKMKSTSEGAYRVKNLFLKSMGILGDSEDQYSMFYKYFSSKNSRVNRNDKRIIKLHYHKALQSGMSRDEIKSTLFKLEEIDQLVVEKL